METRLPLWELPVMSPPTFDRDFDVHYRRVTTARLNLHKRDFQAHARQLQAKHERGRRRRTS